jgi:methionyl-tRNA formyltransferase
VTKYKYFFGSDFRSIPYLTTLNNFEESIMVVTTEPVRSGRGNKLVVNPVEEFCNSNNIEFIYFSQDAVYKNMDIGISASFAKIFSSNFLKLNNNIFNIHLSLLPELRGPSPVENAILNNSTTTGFTIFRIDEDIDTGKIIYQLDVPISENDYASNIYERLSNSFNEKYKEIDFLSTGKEQPQNSSRTFKFSKSDFNISEDTLLKAKTKIRAFNIMGPSFTSHKNKILKIHSYTEESNSEGIMYKEGVLYPEYVTPEGKNKMLFPDYLRGLK